MIVKSIELVIIPEVDFQFSACVKIRLKASSDHQNDQKRSIAFI